MKELVRKCFLQKSFETDKYQRALEQREGMIVVLEKEKDILLEMVRQKRIEVRELKLTQEEKDKEIAHIRIDLEARLKDYNPRQNLVNLRMSETLPSAMNESVNTKVQSNYDPTMITKKQNIEKSSVLKPPTSSHSSDVSNLETIQELIDVSDSDGDGAEDDYSEDEEEKEETQGGDDKENDLEERVGKDDDDTSSKRQEDPSKRKGGDGDDEGNGREEVADGDKTQILIEQVEELLTSTNSVTSSQNGKQKDNLLFDLQRRILEDDSENEKSAEEGEGDEDEEEEEREERVESPGSEEEDGRGGSEDSCVEEENKDQAGANVIRLSDKMFNKLEKVELTEALVSNVLTEAHSSDNKEDVKTKHEREVSLKKEAKSIPSVSLPVDETNGRSYKIPSSSSEEEGTPIKRKSYDFELYRGAIEEDVPDKTKRMENAKEQPAVFLKSNSVERVDNPVEESSRALVLYNANAVSGPPPAKKRKRQGKGCGECSGCLVTEACDKCKHCLDKPRNGGKNTLRQKCIEKRCTA